MAVLEVWSSRGRGDIVALTEPSYLIGSDPTSAQIALDDATVSGVHAAVERVGPTWLVRDLGSRNGTRVGHERLVGQRQLRDAEEILVGRCRLVFRDSASSGRPRTDSLEPPPDNVTKTERRVLIELCRPMLSHNTFQPPASVQEVADRLVISKNGVQNHLVNLYDKFGLVERDGSSRRVALANEAISRGVVTLADLGDSG
jgi:pSer/pThr/pTyr-binding forkhead associated (FHA) protein